MLNGTNSANLIATDPQLLGFGDYGGPTNAMRPGPSSPAIGVGSNAQGYAFDQRGTGYPRDAGGAVDIGAIQGAYPAAPVLPSIPVPALAPAALGALSFAVAMLGLRRRRR